MSFWANQALKLAGLAQIQAFGSLTKIAPPRMFLAFHILALANLESAQSLFRMKPDSATNTFLSRKPI